MDLRRNKAIPVLTGLGLAAALAAAGAAVATSSGPSVPVRRGQPAPTTAAPTTTGASVVAAPTTTTSSTLAPAQSLLIDQLAASMGGTVGCAMAQSPGGPLLSVHPDVSLATASTQKLVVGAAALAALGPDYRFVTRVEAAGPPVNGTVPRLWSEAM